MNHIAFFFQEQSEALQQLLGVNKEGGKDEANKVGLGKQVSVDELFQGKLKFCHLKECCGFRKSLLKIYSFGQLFCDRIL